MSDQFLPGQSYLSLAKMPIRATLAKMPINWLLNPKSYTLFRVRDTLICMTE